MVNKYIVTYYSYLSNVYCVYDVGFDHKKEANRLKKILEANGHTNVKVETIRFAKK